MHRRPVFLILGLWLGVVATAGAKERWTRVESPFFTLYAQCGVRDARNWAVKFDQFRRFVSDVIRVPPTQLQPLVIVLFNDRDELLKYLPHKDGHRPTKLSSLTMTLPTGAVVITSLNWEDSVTRQSFYEAGTYWFLTGFKYSGPDWFKAGLAETFRTFLVTSRDIRVGESPKAHLLFLQGHPPMPLPQLFGIEMKDLDFNGDDRTNLFFAESWALVHYHLFGRDASHQGGTRAPQLGDFMEALQKREEAEPAFRRVFGTDYDGMLQRLTAYVANGKYSIVVTKFDPEEAAAGFTAEAVTDPGVEMIHGYAALAADRMGEARQHFLVAGSLPGGELAAEEALGDTAIDSNDAAEAQVHYTRATELGSRNYRAYYYLGYLPLRDAANGANHLPRVEGTLARTMASRFEQAINLYPRYVPSYEGLAVLMPSLGVFSESDRQFLELGTKVAPDNDLIAAGLGVWEMRNGQEQTGRERLSALVADGRVPPPTAKAMVQQVLAADTIDAGMAETRRRMDEGSTTEAGALVEKMLEHCEDSAQRARLVALQGEIGELDLVIQAEQRAAEKDWAGAEVLARSALEQEPPAALAKRAEAVLARAAAKK